MKSTIASSAPAADPLSDTSRDHGPPSPESAGIRTRLAGWSDRRWAAILAAAFFCVAAIGIAHHEMWRDEWQAWMLARDSGSIMDLLANLRHEGHPPTWHLILFLLSRFTRSPVAMQAVHLAIATTSIYLVSRFAPLPWLHKVLLAFGYFLFYEYAVIARQYALGAVALFAFCALFPHRHRHPVPLFLALLALLSTSVYGLIISISAGGMLVVEAVATSKRHGHWLRRKRVLLPMVAWVTGLAIATLVIRPPAGFSSAFTVEDALSRWSLAATISTVARVYLPLPDLSGTHLWNTHFLDTGSGEALALALALGFGSVLLFLRKPAVLFLYVAGTGGLLAFHHLIFSGTMRHNGHLFLVLVACLWLSALPTHEWRLPTWLDRLAGIGARLGAGMVTVVLLVQVAAAALLYMADLRGHFTAAPHAAEFIRARGLERLPIGASPAPVASSVAGYLDRPIHYLALDSPGTFVRWSRYPRGHDRNHSMGLIGPFLESAESDVLVLLDSPFEAWDAGIDVEELARFPAGLEHTERYVLYRVSAGAVGRPEDR